MRIDFSGDAFRLLEHFIMYATGQDWYSLADAMEYDYIGFRTRARQLEMCFKNALENES
jgi:hypothetical protein